MEDDQKYQELLQDYVERYQRQTGEACRADLYRDGQTLLNRYQNQYDLLFLDIQMPGINGMETAKRIRRKDPEVLIVFVTQTVQYAVFGYAVHAQNYILKPVSYYAFSRELDNARAVIKKQADRFFAVKTENEVRRLDKTEVTFVETMGHHIIFHLREGEVRCRMSMKKAEALLDGSDFFRCHSAYLVNLSYVESFSESDAQVAGHAVLISRQRKKEFVDAFTRYAGERWR